MKPQNPAEPEQRRGEAGRDGCQRDWADGLEHQCGPPKMAIILPEMVMHVNRLRAMIGGESDEC
jgi:hypothetical protein